jgi:ABC-type phosphate transport system substrate-binding protein
LRPHVRRRTTVILVSVALGLTGVAGCSSSSPSGNAAVVAPPTVAPSQGATQIIATYKKFMSAYVAAYNGGQPDDKTLVTLGGGNGAGLQAAIKGAVDKGIVAVGKPDWSPDPIVGFVDTNATVASVTFCFDPATWKTVTADSTSKATPSAIAPPLDQNSHPPHPAYPNDAVGKYHVLMLMNRDTTGKWTVAQVNAQPDRPCHGLSP